MRLRAVDEYDIGVILGRADWCYGVVCQNMAEV